MGEGNLRAAGLLQMLLSPLFLAAERQQTGPSSGVRCLNSYGMQSRRVDCTWHRNWTVGGGPFYLSFSDAIQDPLHCQLSPSSEAQDEFSCSVEGPGEFGENDEYSVFLHDDSLGGKVVSAVWEDTYEPKKNIKCDPPYDFRSDTSGSRCLMTWKMPEAYVIIWEDMQWQLQFRATHVPWEQAETKTVVTRETWMEIDGSEFTPGTRYVARVRCKTPDNTDYVSQWSEWSNTAAWAVPPGPLVLLAVSVPLCLGALLVLLLLSRSCSRVKSCCLVSVPSPAAFFLPLYASHNGNFQAWIGLKEQDVWLGGGRSTDPGKTTGPGMGGLAPQCPEAISQLSSFRRPLGVEPPPEESVCRLSAVPPDQQDKASNYVVTQEDARAPLLLPGKAPLRLRDPDAAGEEGFPYLPYKNSLFVAQEPQETEGPSSWGKVSRSLLGPGTCSVAPM